MTVLGGIGFTAPWLLLGLVALPVLWLILRAIPPAPIRRRFPGVALLLGLTDRDQVADRTPWWLLLLRMLAVAAMIFGLAGPVLNPQTETDTGSGPVLVVLDGGWASAAGWDSLKETALTQLSSLTGQGRKAALLNLSDPATPIFQPPQPVAERLAALPPNSWQPNPKTLQSARDLLTGLDDFDTIWISGGLAYDGQAEMLALLETRGKVRVIERNIPPLGLRPPVFSDGVLTLTALRASGGPAQPVTMLARGTDPAGNDAILARAETEFSAGATQTTAELSLPAELRARITRFTLDGHRSAGATTLVDDNLHRREVALIAGREGDEGLQLLQPLHYLAQALVESADVLTGNLNDLLPANPDVIVLADIARLSEGETAALLAWVEKGGLLVRFAGPRVAASDVARTENDPLMPVRLRSGGRSVGGAMSWGEPKALAPFPANSPFFGLDVPPDVRITAQVMAQPDPTLATRVIAELTDGTPLVTRNEVEQGQVVLFHVTANAEWSSLPLSGLFVQMLARLSVISGTGSDDTAEDLSGTVWTPQKLLSGLGSLQDAGARSGVDGAVLLEAPLGPDLPPGLYSSDNRVMARNVLTGSDDLTRATWPAHIPVSGPSQSAQLPLGGLLLAIALAALAIDIVASLALAGRLGGPRGMTAALLLALLLPPATDAQTAQEEFALNAATEVTLAHVKTGDDRIDEIAGAGLKGLSDVLSYRTSVEPSDPVAVDLETDDLSFFPVLYWPIAPDQPRPTAEAYDKLNAYLRGGGLILFDTRDADLAGFGSSSPTGRKLQQLAAPLDIPPLEPVPSDHVLTRTFYLLQDFPGRHTGRRLWVEAAPADAQQIEGMPFRNLNDGVTPVVIGGNDWASAWAVTDTGRPLLPIGRGFSGERQRELAYRFGVNLVMHVLTGNYKSDQVHVPALLDRLGQ